ncbi:Smr/MutS family protein [bacterium]|nr:Smr/MutS family protein [bacterium]
MKKKKDLFNPAFQNLHKKIESTKDEGKASEAEPPTVEEAEPPHIAGAEPPHIGGAEPPNFAGAEPPHIAGAESDDNQYFLDAVSDVTPLPSQQTRVTRPPGPNIKPSHPAPDDDQEAMAHLYDLVKGTIEMDITFSDEYIEGSVKGLGHKLMRRLKKGQFPIQDYIDLHGLTKQEAEIEVRNFLLESHKLGLRCVLIVHGRGLNSPDSFPVLKDGLPVWLNRGPVKRIVLAFATAKPYDGGTGAIYVLLRKR